MGLLNQSNKTAAELFAERADESTTRIFQHNVFQYNQLMLLTWKNTSLTPIETMAALGNNAVKFFTLGAGLKELILSVNPEMEQVPINQNPTTRNYIYLVPTNYEIEFDVNTGSVSLTEIVEEEEEQNEEE